MGDRRIVASGLGGLSIVSGGLGLSGGSGSLGLSGLLVLVVLGLDEHIDHDIPRLVTRDGLTEAEDLTGDHPEDEGDGVTSLVVARDGDIDVTERRVGVGESDRREVDIGSLSEGLVILQGVADEQETRLIEVSLDIVREGTRGELSGDHVSSEVLRELESSALGIRSGSLSGGGNNADIASVLDGDDRAGSQDDLLPGLAQINDVDSIGAALVHIIGHLDTAVTVSEVNVARQHHLDVLRSEVQSSGELAHFQ